MSKVVCPYCFEKFDRSETMFRCSNVAGCKKEDDSVLHQYWGVPQITGKAIEHKGFSIGKMMGGMPDSAACPECGQKSFWTICPRCHNRIPREMVKNKGFIISIIGARSSGKTNYITTLIDELKRHGHTLGNIGTIASAVANDPKNATEVRYQRDFYDVLYRKGKCPPQTTINDPNSRIPLIYELNKKGKTPTYLVFYDTAGENFNDTNNIAGNVRFLNESDAIIFLLDTFAIPYVHDKLQGKLGLSDRYDAYDTILTNLNTHFSQGDPAVNKAYLEKPMALVFSKIDAILSHADMFEDTAIAGIDIHQNSSFLDGSGVMDADLDQVSTSLMGALQAWGEQNFMTLMDSHKKVKYFGISALGSQPDANNSIAKVRPYRVLDPLVWILDELGFQLPKAK